MGRLPCFAGIQGRRARQRARRGIKLHDAGITKKTQERYYSAVSTLCKTVTDAASMDDLDDQVADWIQKEFELGAPLNTVADALSGLHYFVPATRRKMPMSWKLFGIWRKTEIPARAPPLPEDLLWAMMSAAVQNGQFDLASLLGLGFHCFLRTGELLAIRPIDLLLRNGKGVVHLPASKGGTRHNIKESVTIFDATLVVLLQDLLRRKKEKNLMRVPIWTRNGNAFRDEFSKLADFFGVSHLRFRGYSLRRGGATAFFNATGLMEKTLIRGRWASVSVAKLYLCDSLAQLPSLVASAHTQQLVKQYRAFWS